MNADGGITFADADTSDALLPGENRATSSVADIEYWLEVYTGLVARCRQRGRALPRLESRLGYWQRRHLADPTLDDVHPHACGDTDSSTPRRCPLSTLGLNSDVMAACPGFETQTITYANLTEKSAVTGTTCSHIQVQRTARGFAAFCAHPNRTPVAMRTPASDRQRSAQP